MTFLSTQIEIKDLPEEQLQTWQLMALPNHQKPFTLALLLGKPEKQGKPIAPKQLPDAELHYWKAQLKFHFFQ